MAFVLSKLLWAILSPGSMLVFLLAGGLALSTMSCSFCAKWGKLLCVSVAFCLILIATLPVGEWALLPLENRFVFTPPDQVDGIILIGGDEKPEISEARGIPTAMDSMRRYMTFDDMARRYPDAKLIFSGGSGHLHAQAHMLDSDVARDALADMGVPVDHLIIEKSSRNTYENAVFTADLVRPEPSQKWLLVTSAWHMPRAIGCFRKAGWTVFPAPTGYFTTGTPSRHLVFDFDEQMHYLTIAIHEYVGLVAYWLMGRTSNLWPG